MEEKKEVKSRRKYSKEFKSEAVMLAIKEGVAKTAKNLGVHEATIRLWKRQSESASQNGPDKASYSDLEKEVRKLRKELEYQKEISEVLKKSVGILSNDKKVDLK